MNADGLKEQDVSSVAANFHVSTRIVQLEPKTSFQR